jgi:hypothetical protein
MAAEKDALVQKRIQVLDSLITNVSARAKPPEGEFLGFKGIGAVSAGEPQGRSELAIIMDQALLTPQDAVRQCWALIGRGLRRMRDYAFSPKPERNTIDAASKVCMRNAEFMAGRYLITPPEFEVIRPLDFSRCDPEGQAHEASASMVALAEHDVDQSRKVVMDAIRKDTPGLHPLAKGGLNELASIEAMVKVLAHVDNIALSSMQTLDESPARGRGKRYQRAVLTEALREDFRTAGAGAVPAEIARMFRVQMEASLGVLEESFARVCREFRHEIGYDTPPPVAEAVRSRAPTN